MLWCFVVSVLLAKAFAQGPIVSTLSGDVQGRVMNDAAGQCSSILVLWEL